jgi:flavin-dependent dehydrogenase
MKVYDIFLQFQEKSSSYWISKTFISTLHLSLRHLIYSTMEKNMETNADIIICGGGISGLCLAMQLRLYADKNLTIVVIDRITRPLPKMAYKVGESSIHVGGTYFDKTLREEDYTKTHHIKKFGVRIFFTHDENKCFESRPEFGRSGNDPDIRSYQFDRGELETYFREKLDKENILFYEGWQVTNIETRSQKNPKHIVTIKKAGGDEIKILQSDWLVDASGRRKLLQRTLGLEKPVNSNCSAAWMRVDKIIDVAQFVPKSNHAWHDRICHMSAERGRANSTCHLVGPGYWVWLILLKSGMSVGLVTDESIVPFESYNSQEKFLNWMQEHEPNVAQGIQQANILDFKFMRKYSYLSQRVVSNDRWACTGEAAFFADPFFSPGFDVIAIANSLIAQAIILDKKNQLTENMLEDIDQMLLSHGSTILESVQRMYHSFDDEVITSFFSIFWLAWAPSYLGNWALRVIRMDYLQTTNLKEDKEDVAHHQALLNITTKILQEWSHQKKQQCIKTSFEWIDFSTLPLLKDFKNRAFNNSASWQERIHNLERMVVAIYMCALKEINPEAFAKLPEDAWPNIYELTLDSTQWQIKGTFTSTTPPQNYKNIMQQLTELYTKI